jgi:hypothetical protein
MQDTNAQYDVAISFLSKDEPLAQKLYGQLSESLSVFVYSKRQEELAGTDGLASFRQAFRAQSRLVVVLYRDGWGQTPWTRIEELAIKDRIFAGGWQALLFVMLDRQSTYPDWLPETYIRLDYEKFPNDLPGAIRLRALESGSSLKADTAVEKAKRIHADAQARAERNAKLSHEASAAMPREWEALRHAIDAKVAEIKQSVALQQGSNATIYTVRSNLASLIITTTPYYSQDTKLHVQVYSGRQHLPEEQQLYYMPGEGPNRIGELFFYFDYNAAHGWCWRAKAREEKLFSTEALSDFLVQQLLDAHTRVEAGKTARSSGRHRILPTEWS